MPRGTPKNKEVKEVKKPKEEALNPARSAIK